MKSTTYILGHTPEELRRLELQATVLEPLTMRLLDASGLAEGMRVLDIGTGAGDVAMLAAARVGPSGRVLAVDRTEAALRHAQARAKAAKLDWIRFEAIEFGAGATLEKFDLVIARYVLMHQPDPASFLRQAASHVTPGGAVAVVEMAQTYDKRYSIPPVAPYDATLNALRDAFTGANADLDVGSRLAGVFAAAGLAEPALVSETPVGASSSILPEWAARTLHSVRPTPDDDPRQSWVALADAIRAQASASHSQLFGPRNVAAWARVVR